MKSFCCFASGEDFPGELIDRDTPIGFFVSVFVNAVDPIEAESKSRELLLAHPKLVVRDGTQLPENATISFKVVHELGHHVEHAKVTEFQFFGMDD